MFEANYGNGDYLSRFERVEKTLEAITGRLNTLTGDVVELGKAVTILSRDVTTMHGTMKGLKENNDQLVLAIRDLIDRIPADRL